MAEETAQSMPGPPAGFQRPGIPGAGNILDPEVRGAIREQLQDAVHGATQQVRGEEAPVAAPAPAAQTPLQGKFRAGPFPHGDVDLSNLPANVPQGAVRPERARARHYYFLKYAAADTRDEPAPAPPIQPAPGPKPG